MLSRFYTNTHPHTSVAGATRTRPHPHRVRLKSGNRVRQPAAVLARNLNSKAAELSAKVAVQLRRQTARRRAMVT